jgi:sirohydrochlorin cobaltochelatase
VTTGIVLFAHGSREPEWSVPFERLAGRVRELARPARVMMAYLEIATPTLDEAVASLAADGATEIVIAPLFLAPGGHVRRDLPRMVDALRARHPGVTMRVLPAIGEADPLLDALAAWIAAEGR